MNNGRTSSETGGMLLPISQHHPVIIRIHSLRSQRPIKFDDVECSADGVPDGHDDRHGGEDPHVDLPPGFSGLVRHVERQVPGRADNEDYHP